MDLQLFAEKTEEATPRRREEARKQGQVFKSMELVGAFSLLATYLALKYAAPFMAGRVFTFSKALWEQGTLQDWSESGVQGLMINVAFLVALVAAPVALAGAAAGLIGNIVQVGFISPARPWRRSLSGSTPAAA